MTRSPRHADVLVIGTSRGLGRAMVGQYLSRGASVVATVRDPERSGLDDLVAGADGRLSIEQLDITVADQIRALRDRLDGRTFDLLFVNAGVTSTPDETVATVSTDEFTRLMVTNALGPMRVVAALDDLVAPDGTIGIMSSGQGSIANNERGGFEIYRASKSALNQLMRSYAARDGNAARTLLLMAPGWIRTDVGGPDAPLTIDQAIPALVATIDAQRGRPGLRYLDREGATIPW